jgi:hypothetical protein
VTGNAGPGVGGIRVFDGERWHNFNVYTHGLGGGYELWLACASRGIAVLTVETEPASFALAPPDPGIAGEVNTLTATGATPDARVFFVAGRRLEATPLPGCPGVTFDIGGARLLGKDRADGAGLAEIAVSIPPRAAGLTAYFQAIERSTCSVTPPVEFTFP